MTHNNLSPTFKPGNPVSDEGSKPKSPEQLTEDVLRLESELKKTKESFEKSELDLKEAIRNTEKSKFELITLLGLFVGLITYLGLEIQVFKVISDPLLVIGISIFFIASILLFILTMNLILKNDDGHIKFKSPLYKILVFLLVCSIGCIAYENYLTHKDMGQNTVVAECASQSLANLFWVASPCFAVFTSSQLTTH